MFAQFGGDEETYRYVVSGIVRNGSARTHLLALRLRFTAYGFESTIETGGPRWLEPGESVPFSVDALKLMSSVSKATATADPDVLRVTLRDMHVVAVDGHDEHTTQATRDSRNRFDAFMREATAQPRPSDMEVP